MNKNKKKILYSALLMFALIVHIFAPIFTIRTTAAASSYSGVLDDLQKDENFKVSDYPSMSVDYFKQINNDKDEENNIEVVNVIQISEGEDGYLFIYTYQPLDEEFEIQARSIVLATTERSIPDMDAINDSTDFKKYSLKCVSSEGTLKKYLVEDFTVKSDFYRYYSIAEIERPFHRKLDESLGDHTITNYKAHAVGQAWCCYYQDNQLKYEMITLKVVEIEPTICGELFYENGITWGTLVGINSSCVSHYIAFNVVNFDVDNIIDASLVYKSREYRTTNVVESGFFPGLKDVWNWIWGLEPSSSTTFTAYPHGQEYVTKEIDIYQTDVVKSKGKGLLAKTYSWNRIMTGTDFVTQYEAQGGFWAEQNKSIVENSQFVFAFCETDFASTAYSSSPDSEWGNSTYTTIVEGTEIAKIDILRLKFVVDGDVYNLGVVSDTVTSDGIPDGVAGGLNFDFDASFETIIALLGLLILVVLFGNVVFPILNPLFTALFKLIFNAGKMILKIFLYPFKLIFRHNQK